MLSIDRILYASPISDTLYSSRYIHLIRSISESYFIIYTTLKWYQQYCFTAIFVLFPLTINIHVVTLKYYFGQLAFVLCLPTFTRSKKARRLKDWVFLHFLSRSLFVGLKVVLYILHYIWSALFKYDPAKPLTYKNLFSNIIS